MIGLILGLAVLGVILYLIETMVPIDAAIKVVIRVLVLICVVWYLANLFGVIDLPVPRVR